MSVDRDLQAWLERVAIELNCSVDGISVPEVLNVARDVAHHQIRPGAPTSTFLIGYALGLWEQAERDSGHIPTNERRLAHMTSLCHRIQNLAFPHSAE